MRYRQRRYSTTEINLSWLGQCAELVHAVNNPLPKVSYLQARIMGAAMSWVLVIGPKISRTAQEHLEDGDVLIYRLRPDSSSTCDQIQEEAPSVRSEP